MVVTLVMEQEWTVLDLVLVTSWNLERLFGWVRQLWLVKNLQTCIIKFHPKTFLIAWLACVGLICGGLLLICGSRNPDPEDEGRDYRPYPNDPPRYDTNLRTNGRNNPGYAPDPQPYQPNYNKPSRVYIWGFVKTSCRFLTVHSTSS